MQVKELIDALTDRCTILAQSNDATIEPVDHNLLWDVLFSVANNVEGNFTLLQTVLGLYRSKIPNFNDEIAIITSKTSDFLDSSKSFQDRIINAKAILHLIPFFSQSLVKKILDATIEITDLQIKETKDIPVEFLDYLSECDIEGSAEEDTPIIISHLQEAVESEKKLAAICVFAPLCHGLTHISPEVGIFTRDTLIKCFETDDDISKIVGCFMLMFAGHLFSHEPDTAPEVSVILNFICPLLTNENEVLRKRANKAYRILLDTEFFLSESTLLDFLQKFKTFPAQYYVEYFKIICSFIIPHDNDDEGECGCGDDDDDEPNIEIIQPIVDFVHENLQSSQSLIRGLCLDAMSDLGYKDKLFIEDDLEEALKVAENLIKDSCFNTYPFIANFLVTLSQCYKEEESERIEKLIVPIINELDNDQVGPLKKRISCAGIAAEIIKSGVALDQTARVSKFVITHLQDSNEDTISSLCNVVHPLSKSFSEEDATVVFEKLAVAIRENVSDNENADMVTLCIEKLIKHHQIPEVSVLPIVNASLDGSLKFLNGTLPHKIFPPCVPPFMILNSFIKKFPSSGSSLLPTLLDWFGHTQFQIAPVILIPLKAAIDAGCFNEDYAEKLATMIREMIGKCEEGEGHELGAFCDAARRIFQSYPQKMGPIIDFLTPLTKFAEAALPDLEEEEDMFDDQFSQEGMSELTNFVFSVYAADDQVEVIDELIGPLMMLLPFEPGCEDLPDILSNLNVMFEDKERFSSVISPGLRMVAELLLMKKSELDEFELEDELIKDLKNTLKNCVKGNKELLQELTKDYKKSRAKLNRFNALIR